MAFSIFSFITRLIEVVGKLTDLIRRFRRLHGLPRGSSFSGGRVLWGPSLEVIEKSSRFHLTLNSKSEEGT